MAVLGVGFVRGYRGKKVVVVKTGLNTDGAEAVQVAPLTASKPPGTTPSIETNTGYSKFWILVKQLQTVKTADLTRIVWAPDKLKAAVVKEIQKAVE